MVAQNLDRQLVKLVGRDAARMSVHKTDYPSFRFIDFYLAVERYCRGLADVDFLAAQTHEDLAGLFQVRTGGYQQRPFVPSNTTSWSTGPDSERAIPTDGFRVIHASSGPEVTVIRLRFAEFAQSCILEVASNRTDSPARLTDELERDATDNSVYRGQMLHFAYQSARKDQYGDVERPERLQVTFARADGVPEEDIILSEQTRALLKRNVVDLFDRKELLERHGVPTRRGVLLYGPPGTGKTFACRHICDQLPSVTKIFVTGASLGNVGAIFTLARLLQPSIVFIEDADLMFSSREINLYSSSLGELMDQLDGLRPKEDVSVVMTTNAIDRIESALKDRPGRISQCIFMGAPKADLRRRLIVHLLNGRRLSDSDLDTMVKETSGASQAFLKEWVHRAMQIGCERLTQPDEKLELQLKDFMTALDEMSSNDAHSGSIIGFARN